MKAKGPSLGQMAITNPPDELKTAIMRAHARARKFHWQLEVRYSQHENYTLAVMWCRSHDGIMIKDDQQVIVVRFKHVTSTGVVKFASADKYMRAAPTTSKEKLPSLKAAIDLMKEQPAPKPPRIQRDRSSKSNTPSTNSNTDHTKETKEMATATATKRLKIKKAATATPTKATAKKASAASTNGKDQSASAAARDKRDAALTTKVVAMRKKDISFTDIGAELDIPAGKARILMLRHEAGPAESATPAKVKKDRDQGSMGWAAIAAKYGLRKAGVVKLYREAGGDTKAKPAAAPKAAKRITKKAAAKAEPVGDALFTNDSDKDLIIEKLNGKRITFTLEAKYGGGVSEPTRVKDGTIKVGDQKNGTRIIQFSDGDKSRTVAVNTIVKVTR